MKTLYLDPTYNKSKFRSEFRFPPNMLIYSDVQVLNLGLEKTDNGNTTYTYNGGAMAIIKSLELYDGSTLLDQVQNFDIYNTIKNLQHTNDDNQSQQRIIKGNRLGFIEQGNYTYSAAGALALEPKIIASVPAIGDTIYGLDATAANKQRNGKILNVQEYLGIMRDTGYFAPNVFTNLRLVINYYSNVLNAVVDRTGTYATLEPYISLRYEEDENKAMDLMQKFTGMSFQCVEQTAVRMDAGTNTTDTATTQEVSYFIKAFNDKYIEDVILVNIPTAASQYITGNNTDVYGNSCSIAQWAWTLSLRINGTPWFPNCTITGKNRRLARLVDSIGDVNVITLQNWVNIEAGFASAYTGNLELAGGRTDYTAWRIDDLVKEWKMTVSRASLGRTTASATGNVAQREALNLNLFATSRKNITVTNGGYTIRYV
jgi:hypothetical protein